MFEGTFHWFEVLISTLYGSNDPFIVEPENIHFHAEAAPEDYLTQFSAYSQWTMYAIYYNLAFVTVTYTLKHKKRYFLFFHKFQLLVFLSHCISSNSKWSFLPKQSVHISVEKVKQGITSCYRCLHSQNFYYWKPKWFSSEFVSDWRYLHMCNLF